MCDFGLSRKIEEEEELEKKKESNTLTEYFVTKYYRAPKIMLSSFFSKIFLVMNLKVIEINYVGLHII